MPLDLDRFRQWLAVPVDELMATSPVPFTLTETRQELHERFAQDVLAEIAEPRRRGEKVSLILPLGPTGQYPILACVEKRTINSRWQFYG